ncbi:MAG: mannonate dehydratase [Planctomycetota bacterium]|nr:mannonate dehydratase [Planctomycetota bacterium]
MKLATVLTPMSAENLQLAAQCGVTDFVTRHYGPDPARLIAVKQEVEAYGLTLSVIEGYLPIEKIKTGTDHDGAELAELKELIRQMGNIGIPILCYNFMAGTDWVRTRLDVPERGGAKVTQFNLATVEQAVLLGHDGAGTHQATDDIDRSGLTHARLWDNLERLLNEIVPIAEQAGVLLSMHPDDPPLHELLGRPRIMNSVENFEKLLQLVPSPNNGICFCQGTFAEMGADIPAAIRRLGSHINYVHFRDVNGTAESFTETFHDNGKTDMAAAVRAYREVGFNGPIRPDHVPQLVGEDDGEPGYTMLGRLYAYGYMKGLFQATQQVDNP